QAEDGIRDRNVTGVQTCALPICSAPDATYVSFLYDCSLFVKLFSITHTYPFTPPTVMPCVKRFCTMIYKMSVGNITTTIPAYIGPYLTAARSAASRFNNPTGNVLLSPGLIVNANIYSFQKSKKLNKTTMMILGFAIGSITLNIVRK